MKGDRERCIAAGMDGYLSKPIRAQELEEILDKYVARRTEGPIRPSPQYESKGAILVVNRYFGEFTPTRPAARKPTLTGITRLSTSFV